MKTTVDPSSLSRTLLRFKRDFSTIDVKISYQYFGKVQAVGQERYIKELRTASLTEYPLSCENDYDLLNFLHGVLSITTNLAVPKKTVELDNRRITAHFSIRIQNYSLLLIIPKSFLHIDSLTLKDY